MTVTSINDLYSKLHRTDKQFKGFIMSEELESFCMLYIDTEKIMEANMNVRHKLPQVKINIDPASRMIVETEAVNYVKRFLDGTNQYSFLDMYFNDYIPSNPPSRKKRTGLMRWLFGE